MKWINENCEDQQLLIELEFYKHELRDNGEHVSTGPFFRWALADDLYPGMEYSHDPFADLFGFFLDDLAMDPLKTCYLDMCENNPCNDDQICESTWDGTDAGFTCKGKVDLFLYLYCINNCIYIDSFKLNNLSKQVS